MAVFETIYFQGSDNGKFNYPWGICTDSLGFIYVCDKENHRIQVFVLLRHISSFDHTLGIVLDFSPPVQVFQSDGTFVAKFGSMGSKPGQLEHPHYIAVSNTNRVIVSDSNNHRLQVKLRIRSNSSTWSYFFRSLTWTEKFWPPLDRKEQRRDNSSSPGSSFDQ